MFAKDGVAIPLWVSAEEIDGEVLTDEDVQELNEEWSRQLDLMIQAFQLVIDGAVDDPRVDSGLRAFVKHYVHLWD